MRDFHTRERIVTHVTASSKRCNAYYCSDEWCDELSADVVAQLEKSAYENTVKLKAQGRRRTYANNEPPKRLYGPLTAGAHSLGVRHDCLLKKPPQKVQAL